MDRIDRIGLKWVEWTEVEQIVLNGTKVDKIGPRWAEMYRID